MNEAAWALNNVAKGTSEQKHVVIMNGAIPLFVQLLASASASVKEQALMALGNFAADSPSFRDLILDHGALHLLLSQLNKNSTRSVLRAATRTLSNLCRGLSDAQFAQVEGALPFIQRLLYLPNEEVLRDACRALCFLYDPHGPHFKVETLIEAGASHPSLAVSAPALITVANILSDDDIQTQFLIDRGVLRSLHHVLNSNHGSINHASIKAIACQAISNITVENTIQIQ
ncbi:hypothetical protein Dimus_036344, partial [Dionaea muscipula]